MTNFFHNFGIRTRNNVIKNGGMNSQAVELRDSNTESQQRKQQKLQSQQIQTKNTNSNQRNQPGNNIDISHLSLPNSQNNLTQNLNQNSVSIQNIRLPDLGFLSPVSFNEPLIIKPRGKTYSTEQLSVAETKIENNNFRPIYDNGVSVYRPEIISIADFNSIWQTNWKSASGNNGRIKQYSPIGQLLNVQFQASHLRQETLIKLVDNIQKEFENSDADDMFREIKQNYKNKLSELDLKLRKLKDLYDSISSIKTALQIREIPKALYGNGLTLEDFYKKKMQYSTEQYKIFSETKLLLQLLSDFRSIAESYSFSLLDLKDPDRESDYSPITIDKTYTLTDNFSFNVSNLRSSTETINASGHSFFTNFLNSLPNSSDERIRILTVVLSKEFLVSKGLGKKNIQKTLRTVFDTDSTGNPFDNLIGEIGKNIFTIPRGQNSLSSLLFVEIPNIKSALVLPFETKYIDSDDQKFVYVPGSSYFVDSILQNVNNNKFNTTPLVSYIDTYNKRLSSNKEIIKELFDIKNINNSLSPSKLNETFLASARHVISSMTVPTAVNQEQAIISALFKLASTDNSLKGMLFQYCLLAGMSANNTTTQQREIFKLLAIELKTVRNLSYIRVPTGIEPNPLDGLSILRPYIEQLAKTIEKRVLSLTARSTSGFSGNLLTHKLISTLRPNIGSFNNDSNSQTSTINKLANLSAIRSNVNRTVNSQNINLPLGTIANALLSIVVPSSANESTYVAEYISLADKLAQAAQDQGNNTYLINDATNRTRYNFLSTSTQLLLLFEVLSSYASKYNGASFERSNNAHVSVVSVDTDLNLMVKTIIDDLLTEPVPMPGTISSTTADTSSRGTPVAAGVTSRTQQVGNNGPNSSGGPVLVNISSTDDGSPRTPGILVRTGGNQQQSAGFPDGGGGAGYSSRHSRGDLGDGANGGGLMPRIPGVRTNNFDSGQNDPATRIANSLLNNIDNNLANYLIGLPSFNRALGSGRPDIRASLYQGLMAHNSGKILDHYLQSSKFSLMRNSLKTNKTKIKDEYHVISNILNILTVIGNYLQSFSEKINNEFGQDDLVSFVRNNGITNFRLVQNPVQIQASAFILNNIKEKTPAKAVDYLGLGETRETNNGLVVSDVIREEEYNALLSLLSETIFSPGFDSNRKVKILTVGVPAGFSNALADRVDLSRINKNTFMDKEFDVISVNVYRRDARFDDIVFKPQKFFFDLSLFVLESDIIASNPADESFEILSQRMSLTDFTNITAPIKINQKNIVDNTKYNFMTISERRKLIKNHLTSHLLNSYINLISGMNLSEESFIKPFSNFTLAEKQLKQKMTDIVIRYLREIKRKDIPSTIVVDNNLNISLINDINSSLDMDSRETLRLLTFGSLMFSPEEVENKVFSSKTFDRVFNIPLNIENFEIDLNLTLSTESGRTAWNQRYVQDNIILKNNNWFLKPRDKNDIIFDDYFVCLETGLS